MTVRPHLWISGRVQGVGFRGHTERRARRLDLKGWVRNLPDGRVEVVAEGGRDAVEEFLAWCRRGPRHARVDSVREEWGTPHGEKAFRITTW